MSQKRIVFTPNLSNSERQQLRERLKKEYIERAIREAAEVHVSMTCRTKPVDQHYTCIGRTGCLCPCHDVTAKVLSRTDHR